MASITALTIYPVKSCKGIPVTSAFVTPAGLLFDRQWMVVREDTGKLVSQRQVAKIALVAVSLPEEALSAEWDKLPVDASLTLQAPDSKPFQVPLLLRAPLTLRKATVWEWNGHAADEGDAAAAYLSQYLGLAVRLVRYIGSSQHRQLLHPKGDSVTSSAEQIRMTDPQYAEGFETSFADGFPLLLTSEASMSDLNGRMHTPLAITRFRGNIVVDGVTAWAEDTWRDMRVLPKLGGTPIALVNCKPCSRCTVPTIDQATSEKGDEPLDALNTFRTGANLGYAEHKKSMKHEVFFGVNIVPQGTGVISVGDSIECVASWTGFAPAVA